MKRIGALIIILLSICFTACGKKSTGMEKAFECEVGKTTYKEFCNHFPESSYSGDEVFVTLKEGSYYGKVYHNISLTFYKGVLSEISFDVSGSADEIDNLIAFFRNKFSKYYDSEEARPSLDGGPTHLNIYFDDGKTTLMLWKRDYSQCDPRRWNTKDINLRLSIMNNKWMNN